MHSLHSHNSTGKPLAVKPVRLLALVNRCKPLLASMRRASTMRATVSARNTDVSMAWRLEVHRFSNLCWLRQIVYTLRREERVRDSTAQQGP